MERRLGKLPLLLALHMCCVAPVQGGIDTSAWWYALGEHARARFGSLLSGASDVNGDGFNGLLIGSEGFTGNLTNQGAAYLFLGRTNGFGPGGG